MPSVGTIDYNEGPSNPWHDCGEMKRLWMLERRLPLNLDEEQDTKRRKIFVQGGLARECFSEVILTTDSEVISHGAKADEMKRRQSDLNYLMDMGRLTQEKLRELWGPRRCPRTSVV